MDQLILDDGLTLYCDLIQLLLLLPELVELAVVSLVEQEPVRALLLVVALELKLLVVLPVALPVLVDRSPVAPVAPVPVVQPVERGDSSVVA